jgi:cobaltochelatase CobT
MAKRMRTARIAATAMAEALKQLNINFEVTGFSSVCSWELSQYVNRMVSAGQDITRFSRKKEAFIGTIYKEFGANNLNGISLLQPKEQNPDGEAVRWAAKRLSTQKQKRKILFVLSDGEPATGECRQIILEKDLKAAIEEVKKFGIETVGFGIQTNAVSNFYEDHIVVNNLEELPTICMKKLSKILTK